MVKTEIPYLKLFTEHHFPCGNVSSLKVYKDSDIKYIVLVHDWNHTTTVTKRVKAYVLLYMLLCNSNNEM